MSDHIFVEYSGDRWVAISEEPYKKEDDLQTRVENHPELLAGDQIDPDSPRRWLLITRSAPVPDDISSSGRWSLDDLFLDQDGIPTFVEFKRTSDTRSRREVVAQMLDYAANAIAYWPVNYMQSKLSERYGEQAASMLADFIEQDADTDQERFWNQVQTNLQAGRVRLMFLGNRIPAELQRIVEFLNQQMDPAVVLAVEVPQYVSDSFTAFVPHLLGETARGRHARTTMLARAFNEAEMMVRLDQSTLNEASKAFIKELYAQLRNLNDRFWHGSTDDFFNWSPAWMAKQYRLLTCFGSGRIEISFKGLSGTQKVNLYRRLVDVGVIDPRDSNKLGDVSFVDKLDCKTLKDPEPQMNDLVGAILDLTRQ